MATNKKFHPLRLFLAGLCSLGLVFITVNAPHVPLDWARPDAAGVVEGRLLLTGWPNAGVQIVLLVGMVLLLASPRLRRGRRLMGRMPLCVVSGLTLAGFAVRLFHLGTLPLLIDEIGFAAHASDMLYGQHIPLLAPAHNGNPALFSWMLAGSMGLWGQNTFAIRLIPLAAGVLSIPAIYRLGRAWLSPTAGMAAACVLAFYPAHVHFSRLALYNVLEPLVSMMALTVLVYAMRTQTQGYFRAAGVLAGTVQYLYHGGRLLVFMVVIYAVLVMLRGNDWRRAARGLGWTLLSFILMTAPLWASLATHGLPISGNLTPVRLPADLPENAVRAILAWVGQADVSPFWLGDGTLLPLWMLVFFLIGLGVALVRWREPAYGVLLTSMVLTTVFGGVIQTAAPLYVRYITALPVLILLPVMGVMFLPKRAAVSLLVLICALNLAAILEHAAQAPARVSESVRCETDIAAAAASLPSGMPVTFIMPQWFEDAQKITLAHALAAYGERRTIRLASADGDRETHDTAVLTCH